MTSASIVPTIADAHVSISTAKIVYLGARSSENACRTGVAIATIVPPYCSSDLVLLSGSVELFGAPEYVAEFEALLGLTSRGSRFDGLTEEQCERCVQAIAKDEEEEGKMARSCILIQSFTIFRWQLPGQTADTPSEVSMYYGYGQYLSTGLQFATVEDFHRIQQMLADLGLCKLNEKNLKPVKERKKKLPSGGG